jgi:hypothetical protein
MILTGKFKSFLNSLIIDKKLTLFMKTCILLIEIILNYIRLIIIKMDDIIIYHNLNLKG